MGLDSVELVMEWEDFFQIKIPDLEASKMVTIADAVNYISAHVNYINRGINIKDKVLNDLTKALSELNQRISPNDLIFEIVAPKNEELWKGISRKVDYDLPLAFSSSTVGKWFDKLVPSKVSFDGVTVDRYVDLICAINYSTLLNQGVQNQYEVMVAVMGMTIEKIGVSPFEVFWTSSFTNDLGID